MKRIISAVTMVGLLLSLCCNLSAQQASAAQYLAYGKSLAEQGKPFEAMTYIYAAIKLDQGNTEAMLLLGDTYVAANKFQDAIKWYKHVRTVNPSEWQAFYKEANVWAIMGKNARAVKLLEQALYLNPREVGLKKILVNLRGSDEPPEFPPGTVYLFRDEYAFGVEQKSSNKKSRIILDKKEKKFGSASMLYRLDTKKDNDLNMYFLGAWKSSSVNNPGDLTRFRKKGALVFWVKGIREGEFFDVGFKAKAKEGQIEKNAGKTTMGIRNFVFVNTEWQKVIMPLAEFPTNGYVWRDILTPGGEPTDRQRRVDTVFDWTKADSFYQHTGKLFRPERKYWIDHVVLVPEYDRQEYEFLRRTARKRERVQRGADDFIIFLDEPLTDWWSYPDPYGYVIRDETVFKEGKFSAQFVMDAKSWSGGGMDLPEIDLTPIREKGALEFWVRGENGDEQFDSSLSSRRKGQTYSINSCAPNIRMYLDVSTKWRHVTIPLADFPSDGYFWDNSYSYKTSGPMDWSRVSSISWDCSPVVEKEHTWYMDDIRIVPKSTHTSALYMRSVEARKQRLTQQAEKEAKKKQEKK